MKTRSFSVVTINLNMAPFLARTIESVISNMRPGDEYFVIDGGSSDGSVEILKAYEGKITGWVSERDSGYADALRKGFGKCSGDFFCWVNSGDLLLPGALDVAREMLNASGVDLLMGDDLHIDESDVVLGQSRGGIPFFKQMMLFGPWTPLQDACFWTRSLYLSIGGIDPGLRYAADYAFFLRAAWAGQVRYVPVVFSAFRRHQGQKSIANAAAYKHEQNVVRRSVLEDVHYSRWRSLVWRIPCWFFVRLRHYFLQRLFSTWIPAGSRVQEHKATFRREAIDRRY